MPIKTSLMHSTFKDVIFYPKVKLLAILFPIIFPSTALARYPVFSNGSFSQILLVIAILLALALWRKYPEASIIIISVALSIVINSFYPLAPALICMLYLMHREFKLVHQKKYQGRRKISPKPEKNSKDNLEKIDLESKSENLKYKWVRINETDFFELLNPKKIYSSNSVKVVVQPTATGIILKHLNSQVEVFIPEGAIKDFWKY